MSSKTRLFFAFSILAALVITMSPASTTVTASSEKILAPSQFITMPAASFTPDESTSYYRSYYFIGSLQTDGEFYAPLVLPDGAILRRIYISYVDNLTNGTVRAELRRNNLTTSALSTRGSVESSLPGTTTSAELMTLNVNKLINRYHAYTLYITMDVSCTIQGIRVEYTLP